MAPSLKQSVREALQAYAPLRASRTAIEVSVAGDGRVVLSGYVPSASSKRIAGVLASDVEGVTEVVNELIADLDLERAVAMALAADARTRTWPIRVRAGLGFVQLQGRVPDEVAVETALDVARQVKGAAQVVSSLRVSRPLAEAA
jgi:osmotically-inducible protein OsmY